MKRTTTVGLVLGLALGGVFSGTVAAAPSSNVAWTTETLALIAGGDPAKGETLSQSCAGCHGAKGVSDVNRVWPSLAGQDAGTLYKQMVDYKDGTRASPMMMGMVAALSDQDMADLAAYYHAMPLPPAQGEDVSVPELVTRGDGPRLVPACEACHGDYGKGNKRSYGMPVLAGQNAEYIKLTLNAYKNGQRANDVYSIMRAIARELTDEEMAELAAYYASQGSNEAP